MILTDIELEESEQPDSVEFSLSDNIFVKSGLFIRSGRIVPQHSHEYDHTTLVATGAVMAWCDDAYMGEFEAPCPIFIKAGCKHVFKTTKDNTLIYCIHNIEHIPFKLWPFVFHEFHRLLNPEGFLFMSYPEFEMCAKHFVTNHKGERDFWRNTLYGRQLWPGDFHIAPVITSEISNMLGREGFDRIVTGPAPDSDYYTNLICKKGLRNDKEDVLKRELFQNFNPPKGKFHPK